MRGLVHRFTSSLHLYRYRCNPHFRVLCIALQALTANTVATSSLVNLARAESVEAGGSRRRWRAHPALSPHPVMKCGSICGSMSCMVGPSWPHIACMCLQDSSRPRKGCGKAPAQWSTSLGTRSVGSFSRPLVPSLPRRHVLGFSVHVQYNLRFDILSITPSACSKINNAP